jgi:ATP-binding cassette subfamily F protein uup
MIDIFLIVRSSIFFAFEENGLIRRYPGNYTVYLDLKASEASKNEKKPLKKEPSVSVPPKKDNSSKQSRSGSKEKRELEILERSIQEAESQQSELAARLAAAGSDFALVQQLGSELNQVQEKLEKQILRWTELAEMA